MLRAFSLRGFHGSCCMHWNFQNLVTTLISQKLLKLLGPFSDVNFNRVRILIPRFWRFFCSLIYHHYSTLYLYKQNLETVLNELLFFHRNTKQGKSIKLPSTRACK